jgi:hypothetical protein
MVKGDQITFLRIVLRFPWHMLFLAGVLVTVGRAGAVFRIRGVVVALGRAVMRYAAG